GQFYVDSRVKTITLEHASLPFTVVFEYELKLNDFGMIRFPRWVPRGFEQSCQQASFTAVVPNDNELLYDVHELDEPVVKRDDKVTTYRWAVENLPAIKWEPFRPVFAKVLPNVQAQLRRFKISDKHVGSYGSWKDFGQLIVELCKDRDELPASLKAEINQLVAGVDSEAEKIDLLYRFMQERMRYVGVQLGIGGWQPFSAAYVEKNRFGDCKALSNYMGAILKEVGITSYPVLIYSGNRPFDTAREEFPTCVFNHMILYVPSEDTYLECTSSNAPTGYLSESTLDRNVLLITPEGGQLARTPALEPSEHGHLRRIDLTISEDGSADLAIQSRHYGGEQEYFRAVYHNLSPKEQKEWLHKYNFLPDVSGENYQLLVSKEKPEVALTYSTHLDRYARKMGKRMFVPINKLFAYDDIPPKIEDRKLPVVFKECRFFVDSIYLQLPENLTV
ncbi:MAG: DUF3857 domain-containing protein, partial [Bacteroidota bacterium]